MSPTPNRSRLLPGFVLATVVICLTLFTPARAGAQVGLLPPSYPEDMGLANSLAFSPDGKLLACGCCGPYNDIKDYDILQIWDVATGRETARLKTYGFAAFSPDGKTLAGRGDKGRLQLWEAQSHRIRLDDEAGPYFNVLAFSPDSRLLLTGNDSPQFTLRDAGYGTVLYEEKLPVTVLSRGTVTIQCPIFIYDARFAPDGKEIALAVTTLGAVSKPSQIYLGQIIRDRTGGTRSGKIGLKWRRRGAFAASATRLTVSGSLRQATMPAFGSSTPAMGDSFASFARPGTLAVGSRPCTTSHSRPMERRLPARGPSLRRASACGTPQPARNCTGSG